ncbi:MAG: undecaprenyl-phosphate galactose phosphotransferase WbaP [Planctomycetales bacterium]|nr:undecaprenyl-phosphate galactose phosphotransferase WbaP [Planctomycetales bacterium]
MSSTGTKPPITVGEDLSEVEPGPPTSTSDAALQSLPVSPYSLGQSGTKAALFASGSSQSNLPGVGRSEREVGVEYLRQLFLTAGALVLADLAVICLAIAATRGLFFAMSNPSGFDVSSHLLPIGIVLVVICGVLGLYPGIRLSPVEELKRCVTAVACVYLTWAASLAIIKDGELTVQPRFLMSAFVLCAVLLPIGRTIARNLLGRTRWWGFPTLVCGDDAAALHLLHWVRTNRQLGLRPVGLIASPEYLELDTDSPHYLGSWGEAPRIAQEHGVYWALLVPSEELPKQLASEVSGHLSSIPHIQVLTELTGLPDHWGDHQPVEGLAGIHLQQNLLLPLPRLLKYSLDVVVAALALVLLSPLLLGVALFIKAVSPGPVLYRHKRFGRHGKNFGAWKFRTMVVDADKVLESYLAENPAAKEEWDSSQKLRNDPRVLPHIGGFLRKWSIDELPQLWNVLVGEMSLVGPRPVPVTELSVYGRDNIYGLYSLVRPGITGLWQVSGRNDASYDSKSLLDEYYVRNWTPWLDVYLLMHTVRTVLFAKGAY